MKNLIIGFMLSLLFCIPARASEPDDSLDFTDSRYDVQVDGYNVVEFAHNATIISLVCMKVTPNVGFKDYRNIAKHIVFTTGYVEYRPNLQMIKQEYLRRMNLYKTNKLMPKIYAASCEESLEPITTFFAQYAAIIEQMKEPL